jgi:hypothetical protein
LLEAREREFVLATLEAAVREKEKLCESRASDEMTPTLLRAIHMAGTLKLKEAGDLLAELEDLEYVGIETVYSSGAYRPLSGRIGVSRWREFTIRRAVQLSLRRLSRAPSLYPATQFLIDDLHGRGVCPTKPPSKGRATQIDGLRVGMIPEEVLLLLGAPDLCNGADWYYEIDSSVNFTVVVTWGEAGIQRINRRVPSAVDSDLYVRSLSKW